MTRRRFVDAPTAERCNATTFLRDGTLAQCGRRGAYQTEDGTPVCLQHQRIYAALSARATTPERTPDR